LKPKLLVRLFKVFASIMGVAVLYVLFDFTVDVRPRGIQSSYHFTIRNLVVDTPQFLRQDNLVILVIARSTARIADLQKGTTNLQDTESRYSHQPDFAHNPLRSRHPAYFVSYASGTNLGCALEIVEQGLREICSQARYDYAGRALSGASKFQNLVVPDYNFSNDFNTLTIRP
jgi:ubiquinol-cytochrome c reductase iron-sulfur subunit